MKASREIPRWQPWSHYCVNERGDADGLVAMPITTNWAPWVDTVLINAVQQETCWSMADAQVCLADAQRRSTLWPSRLGGALEHAQPENETRRIMADLVELRDGLTNDQSQLLQVIWDSYLQEHKRIPAAELHRRGGGRRHVREILAGLGGTIVLLNDWDIEPFYRLWALGGVLAPSGKGGEILLERWLAYQVRLFQDGDFRRNVASDEIRQKLRLSEGDTHLLGELLTLLPEWWSQGNSPGPAGWSYQPARNLDEIADEPNLGDVVLRALTGDYDRWGRALPIDARAREVVIRQAPGRANSAFGFVTDARLREILDADWAEAQRTANAEAWKATIILCGGVLEGMLINVLERDLAAANRAYCSLPHARKAPPPPTEWDLGQLIDVAASLKRIPDTTRNPSHAVRGFRSLVHPGRQVRTGQQASQQEAVISVQVIEICLGTLI